MGPPLQVFPSGVSKSCLETTILFRDDLEPFAGEQEVPKRDGPAPGSLRQEGRIGGS